MSILGLSLFTCNFPPSILSSYHMMLTILEEMTQLPIYMDHQSTTPLDKKVLESMLPYFTEEFGNPHSRSHIFGWTAEEAVTDARKVIAKFLNAHPLEIIFTSGATESVNIAIKGVANFYKDKKKHIITTSIEHKCVLDTCRILDEEGFKVTYLPVDHEGFINIETLKKSITPETILVSIQHANSEIGTIQDINKIGSICRENGVFFHTDIAQTFGKLVIDVEKANIDMLSISGHKIYGPKGVGALYLRRKPRVRIKPLITGGGQERGVRAGTLATPLIVGLKTAAEIAFARLEKDAKNMEALSKRLYDGLSKLKKVYLNGPKLGRNRLYNNINMSFSGIEGESLIGAIKEIAVSSGSACTSASLESSYVLHSIGVDDLLAHTSIRFGIGRSTTAKDIDFTINTIKRAIERLREMSPLWEMMEEGVDLDKIQWNY